MPHVAFVTFSGFRVVQPELRELGMRLPGFEQRARALTELPALGLITLAGMLPASWRCSYYAPSAEWFDPSGESAGDWTAASELAGQLAEQAPDIVAISALTASIEPAYRLSDALRRRGVRTVLGGLHVSALPDEAALHADAVVVGPGEPVWPSLTADAAAGRLRPRYVAAKESQAPMQWALPRYDLLGRVLRYTLQTQRGCPLACDFCASSRLIERFREKPLTQIEAELGAIVRLQPRPLIELADDNTFAGQRDPQPLLELFRTAGVSWFTEADWRIGERPELLGQLAASGCVQVLVGLESQVFRYSGMAVKDAAMQRMTNACQALQESGVAVNACFIVGADGETPGSLQRLTDYLVYEAPFAEVQVTVQTAFPGTALRRRLQRENRLLSRGWGHYNLLDVTHRPDVMSVEQLESGYREVVRHVYGSAAERRRRQIRSDINARRRRLRRAAGVGPQAKRPAQPDHSANDCPVSVRKPAGD